MVLIFNYFVCVIFWVQVMVEKIDLYGKLNGPDGCVNTLEFNFNGDILVSGSDDKHVMLWSWATKTKTLCYASGHLDNIFQARIMPLTDDKRIITSSADGQVNECSMLFVFPLL